MFLVKSRGTETGSNSEERSKKHTRFFILFNDTNLSKQPSGGTSPFLSALPRLFSHPRNMFSFTEHRVFVVCLYNLVFHFSAFIPSLTVCRGSKLLSIWPGEICFFFNCLTDRPHVERAACVSTANLNENDVGLIGLKNRKNWSFRQPRFWAEIKCARLGFSRGDYPNVAQISHNFCLNWVRFPERSHTKHWSQRRLFRSPSRIAHLENRF